MFQHHFQKLDLDGDGHISINELRTHFKNMGVRVTARTLNDLMAEVDVNRNGQVEFDEFVAVRAHLSFNFFWSFLLLFFFFFVFFFFGSFLADATWVSPSQSLEGFAGGRRGELEAIRLIFLNIIPVDDSDEGKTTRLTAVSPSCSFSFFSLFS